MNDWCRGTLCATTVAKLPMIIPAERARMAGMVRSMARSGRLAFHRRTTGGG
jgi:hypothetical protein